MEDHIDSPPSSSPHRLASVSPRTTNFILFYDARPPGLPGGRRVVLCKVKIEERGGRSHCVSLTSTLWHQLTPEEGKQPLVTPDDLW